MAESRTMLTMRVRLMWWRVLGGCARLAHRWSRSSARAFAWSGERAGRVADRLSAPAAVVAARRAMRTTPAYAELAGGMRLAVARTAVEWMAQLPVTTKRTYVDRWPLAARCAGGAIPACGAELDESA